MTRNEFIESLNIEENIFELCEKTTIGYLVQYSAPFTGAGEHEIPTGTRFYLDGIMRDDTFYMHIVEENFNEILYNELVEKEKKSMPKLSHRFGGFSFYITEEQLKTLPLKFISGSRENSLEILELLRHELKNQNNETIISSILRNVKNFTLPTIIANFITIKRKH